MKKELPHIKSPGFKIPENYFETLEEQITAKIALQEVASNQNAFHNPSEYFTNNIEKAFAKATQPQHPVKVIPLYKKNIFRYAAAVAAVLLIAVSLFQFQNLIPSATEGNISYSTLVENNYLDLSLIDIEYLITDEVLEE